LDATAEGSGEVLKTVSLATAQFSRLLGNAVPFLYVIATIAIGWASRRRLAGANDFLNASRSLPLWVATCAFLSANCGALDIIGLSAMAAQYGVQAFHFYWIGAIPAMLFLGLVMIPIYMRSGVRSVPEYLQRRFDARVRLIDAWLILGMGIGLSGIGLYAIGQVLHVVFGWMFWPAVVLAAGVVLIYVLLGGLRATIYNEVFQLAVIAGGLLPLLYKSRGSWARIAQMDATQRHLWQTLPVFSHAAPLDRFGVIVGLGFVLSFGYWCTDFVMMQRALTARTVEAGRMVPLLAGFGKLGFSMIVILPALGAAAVLQGRMPASFDQTLPALMAASYGPALLGLGTTAILASLMSGLAANVSAFSAIWTEEIYRTSLRPARTERHYIRVARASIVIAIVLGVAASYLAFSFHNLMEYVQLIFSLFSAPVFGVFVLGIFTRRATARGAVAGLLSGVALAVMHHAALWTGKLIYGSLMSANFYVAIYAFATTILVGLLFSRERERKNDEDVERLVFEYGHIEAIRGTRTWWALACLLLATCAVLNFIWR